MFLFIFKSHKKKKLNFRHNSCADASDSAFIYKYVNYNEMVLKCDNDILSRGPLTYEICYRLYNVPVIYKL